MTERIFRCKDTTNMRSAFLFAWSAAKQFAEPFELVVRPLKAKRSADQNRRMWALLREVAATVWINGRQFSDEVWHRYFAQTFIGSSEVIMPDGTVQLYPISTTTLTVADMGDYMDQICAWCVEQGFPLEEAV